MSVGAAAVDSNAQPVRPVVPAAAAAAAAVAAAAAASAAITTAGANQRSSW